MNEEIHCPNCGKPLRDDELETQRCSACGTGLARNDTDDRRETGSTPRQQGAG